LAAALARLLEDGDLRVRLGQKAAHEARHHWNIESTWESYAALYAEMLAS
jgi:glycosyltransferase involved in cell wall biosynthesis